MGTTMTATEMFTTLSYREVPIKPEDFDLPVKPEPVVEPVIKGLGLKPLPSPLRSYHDDD